MIKQKTSKDHYADIYWTERRTRSRVMVAADREVEHTVVVGIIGQDRAESIIKRTLSPYSSRVETTCYRYPRVIRED